MFRSISESHQAFGLPKPQHQLISLVHFYKITFVTRNNGHLKYGQDYYDFNEGIMLFIAPNQLVGTTEYNKETYAYLLLIHPVFFQGYPLVKKIKE